MPTELAFSQNDGFLFPFFSNHTTYMRVHQALNFQIWKKQNPYRICRFSVAHFFRSFPNVISKHKAASQFPANECLLTIACIRRKKEHQPTTQIKLDIMLKCTYILCACMRVWIEARVMYLIHNSANGNNEIEQNHVKSICRHCYRHCSYTKSMLSIVHATRLKSLWLPLSIVTAYLFLCVLSSFLKSVFFQCSK